MKIYEIERGRFGHFIKANIKSILSSYIYTSTPLLNLVGLYFIRATYGTSRLFLIGLD